MAATADRFVAGEKRAHVSGVLLAALGIFLLISLATHSDYDVPTSSRERLESFNWGGRIGAWFSFGALNAVGYAAYVLPLLGLVWGWHRLAGRPLRTALMRSAGLVGLALVASLAAGLPHYSNRTAYEIGGLFGTEISSGLLIPYLGRPGSVVLLSALVVASLLVGTDIRGRHCLAPLRAAWFAVRAVGRWFSRLFRRHRSYVAVEPVVPPEEGVLVPESRQLPEPVPPATGPTKNGGPGGDPVTGPPSVRERAPGRDRPVDTVRQPPSGVAGENPVKPVPELPSEPVVVEPPASSSGDGGKPGEGRRSGAVAANGDGTAGAPAGKKPARAAASRPPKKEPAADTPPPTAKRAAVVAGDGDAAKEAGPYRIPPFDLLDPLPRERGGMERDQFLQNAKLLEDAMANFDVTGKVTQVSPGPVVTRYEVEPAPGVKVNRIVTLSDDLARVMSAKGIRIQAPVPGRSVVGVEIANQKQETVYLREIVESEEFRNCTATLPMALGKTISGEPLIADLARMPHLLVAGATGSGKSVCINSLISSILFKATPDQVRLLMVDPKVVELTVYNDIPHLLVPVVTEPKKASEALKWAVAEMESRYQLLAKLGVRNLADYNRKVENLDDDEVSPDDRPRPLPYIVVIVDEFADLMITAPADVETSLMSLAQKSRAVGLHIILATQRPSVNVITGVIKANFPSRIGFQVASKTDSRTILDMNGAERLLGRGDMLYLPGGQGEPIRIHGAFISGEETERLVASIQSCGYEAEEVEVFFGRSDHEAEADERDELFDEAVRTVIVHQQASTSFLQRRMKIGYSRAARLMDELEAAGIVGPASGARPRQILVEDQGPSLAEAAAALEEEEAAG